MQALVALLVRLAGDKPALMVFEDLHWIDPPSLELLLDEITDHDSRHCLPLVRP